MKILFFDKLAFIRKQLNLIRHTAVIHYIMENSILAISNEKLFGFVRIDVFSINFKKFLDILITETEISLCTSIFFMIFVFKS